MRLIDNHATRPARDVLTDFETASHRPRGDVRIRGLDHAAASIGNIGEQMPAPRHDESDHLKNALTTMRKNNKTTCHAGVECVRVPGEERLRVWKSRNQSTAESAEPEGEE